MRRELVLSLALAALLLLSACTASESEEPLASEPAVATVEEASAGDETEGAAGMVSEVEAPADHPQDEADMAEQPEEMAAEPDGDSALNTDRPAWQQLALTNARTGETFTLADFAGKTVFVEPMATWCGNCRTQLSNVRAAQASLAADDVVFVGLSVETNIDDGELAQYADEAGFDWLFAVITPELLTELADEFGRTIANPPATPHFVIRADGSTTDLATGIESAGEIVAQIEEARG